MPPPAAAPDRGKSYASSSLLRALDVLDVVSAGPTALADLAERLSLTRSTAYRLAAALADRGLLRHNSRKGYQLGPRILALGYQARESIDLLATAQPVLDALSLETEDATNLAIRDGDDVVYIARSPGRRRLVVRHDLDDRNRIDATALGRALLWDASDQEWQSTFPGEGREQARALGFARHFDEHDDAICCVATPIRDASGKVVAALSLSSAQQYMPEARMETTGRLVADAAKAISRQMGWTARRRPRSEPAPDRVRPPTPDAA